MSGFVFFVSAGPGDPELLTVRAARCLAQADVVLYDDLASGPVLDLARAGAELISVGKRAGRPSAKQEHVNHLLTSHALAGAQVVRLKSGDAGIFGRLEEEILACLAAGIAFEIVPGVTAASAAAARAALPLTRRLTARRVQFITGADVTGGLPKDLNWAALADAGATTVVYMGKRTFPALARALIAHGLPPATPAMLAHGVTTPEEQIGHFTVESLAAHLAGAETSVPALILYGPLAGREGG